MTDQPFTEEDRELAQGYVDSHLGITDEADAIAAALAHIDHLEGQSPARTPGDTDMAATDDEVIEVLEFRLTRAAARIDHLEGALREAADDLGKAANQFEGLKLAGKPPENNGAIFAEKEERARAALDPATEQEDDR